MLLIKSDKPKLGQLKLVNASKNSKHLDELIEEKLGFSRGSTFIVSLLAGLRSYPTIRKLLRGKPSASRVVFSFSHFAQLEYVLTSLFRLEDAGYQVLVFPEWAKSRYSASQLEKLSAHFSERVVFDASRAMPMLTARMYLSTLAGKNWYFPRAATRVFFFHSLASLVGSPHDALRSFDVALCASKRQVEEVEAYARTQRWEGAAKLVGYPKYDDLARRARLVSVPRDESSVLVAPSYFDHRTAPHARTDETWVELITEILNKGGKVCLRLHPLSLAKGHNSMLLNWFEREVTGQGFGVIDTSEDYLESILGTSMLITDISGLAFAYRMVSACPIVFFAGSESELEAHIPEWEQLGVLAPSIPEVISTFEQRFIKYFEPKSFFAFKGSSQDRFFKVLIQVLEGQQ